VRVAIGVARRLMMLIYPTMQRLLWHGVARGLARRTWIVTAFTVASCAAIAARAGTSLVAAAYLSPPQNAADPTARAGDRRAGPAPDHSAAALRLASSAATADERRLSAGRQLVERNPFCSVCRLGGPGGAGSAASGAELLLEPAVLVETSIAGDPTTAGPSTATVRVLGSGVQGAWGLGDAIPGLGRIERIAPTWIGLVDPTGRRGRLSLRDPAAGAGSDTAMSESPPAAPWGARIRRFTDQDYEVDRDLILALVSGAAKPGAMRWVPIVDRGQVKGVKLLGVASDSVAFALGLRTGDAVTAIDGAPIAGANQLLELYAGLDQLGAVELSGTRAGAPIRRTLRLR
jgi:hypothetical protein